MNKKVFSVVVLLASVLVFTGVGCVNRNKAEPAVVPVTGSDVSQPAATDEAKCLEMTAHIFWLYQLIQQKDEVALEALNLKIANLKKQYGWGDEDYNKICNKFGEQSDFITRAGERLKELISGITSPTVTSTAVVSPEALLLEYNLNRFKNKKWRGEIKQLAEGTIGTGPVAICRDARIMLSANFTMEIDAMSIDFDNLSWADQAKKLGIANTASSSAVTVVGTGRIKFQNPWRLFLTPTDKTTITSNPLPVSFTGYIDFANNKLMPLEKFTNSPVLSQTQVVCPYYNIEDCPIGCLTNSGSSEWKAEKVWLRGLTFKLGSNNELILQEPIWNLAELTWEQQLISNMPFFSKGEANLDASGILEIKQ